MPRALRNWPSGSPSITPAASPAPTPAATTGTDHPGLVTPLSPDSTIAAAASPAVTAARQSSPSALAAAQTTIATVGSSGAGAADAAAPVTHAVSAGPAAWAGAALSATGRRMPSKVRAVAMPCWVVTARVKRASAFTAGSVDSGGAASASSRSVAVPCAGAGAWRRGCDAPTGVGGRRAAIRPDTSAAGRLSTALRMRSAAPSPRTGVTSAWTLRWSSSSVSGRAMLPRVCSTRTSTGSAERVSIRRIAASRAIPGSGSRVIRARSLATSGAVATASLNSGSPARPNSRPAATPCRALNLDRRPSAGWRVPMSSWTRGWQRSVIAVISAGSIRSDTAIAASIAGCATTPHG
jgi:hypothetical protein